VGMVVSCSKGVGMGLSERSEEGDDDAAAGTLLLTAKRLDLLA